MTNRGEKRENTGRKPGSNNYGEATVEATLFDDVEAESKSTNLMQVIDTINARMGRGTVRSAAAGIKKPWEMRRERKTELHDGLGGVACGF